MVLKYSPINENKMWGKSISEILQWIELKSDMTWLIVDTETTGLGGPKKQQLTQVSCIATKYDLEKNNFVELNIFDRKIKLTEETKRKFTEPGNRTKEVLKFNRYGTGDYTYTKEEEVLSDFYTFCDQYKPCMYVIQNAEFDMNMLVGRSGRKNTDEVFDTKMLIQLYFIPLIQKLAETDDKYKDMINFIGRSSRDGGLISSSMGKIGPALGIDMGGYHNSLSDIRITMKMFRGIVDLLKNNKDTDILKYQYLRIEKIRSNYNR